MSDKKIAIMQPYFFPYIGYFQLIKAVDYFVFYDDVCFINRGWINRNRVLVNKNPNFITIPLVGASQNRLINEIQIIQENKWQKKLLRTLSLNYAKAPYFNEVMLLVENVITRSNQSLAQFSANSVVEVAKYLSMNTTFFFSSELEFGKKTTDRADRLVEIVNGFKANTYINPEGGKALYSKVFFESYGIDLKFIKPHLIEYRQNCDEFVPGLSIIDVLMHNSKEAIISLLNEYDLN
jgi:hypothetical protein